jgi:hypothetical protein
VKNKSKAPVCSITISREGVSPSSLEVSSFAEANLTLREWVDVYPMNDGYGKTSIYIRWKNGGWFSLILFLEYPEPLKNIDIRGNVRYLIGFALGEVLNPKWTAEENAKALLQEQQSGATEHCRLVRETCLIDDLLH